MKPSYYRSLEDLAAEAIEVPAPTEEQNTTLTPSKAAAEYAFEGYSIELNEKIMLITIK